MKTQGAVMALAALALGAGLLVGCPKEGVVCREGLLACEEGSCRDLQSDPANCGGCSLACADGQVCQQGACACPPQALACAGAPCAFVATDRLHCGACGNACGEGQVCEEGECRASCTEGTTECAGGCFDLQRNAQHCGTCSSACEQGQSCREGRCGYDVVAACLTNGQVRGLQGGSWVQGPLQELGSAPQALARFGQQLLLSIDGDRRLYQASYPGLQQLAAWSPLADAPNHLLVDPPYVYVLNAGSGTLQVLEPGAASSVAELQLGENTFPQVMVKVGSTLYLTLYGGTSSATAAAGQKVVAVDVSDPRAPQRGESWELGGLSRPFIEGGESIPRPMGIAHLDGSLYVALNNLDGFYGVAGPAALAVIPLDGGALSAITLPEDRCLNAGWVRAVGESLLVSCGGRSDFSNFPDVTTTESGVALVRAGQVRAAVEISCLPGVPQGECPPPSIGRFDVVDSRLYLADQAAGRLYVVELQAAADRLVERRTHTAGGGPLTVCPVNPVTGYSNVSDVLGVQSF